MLQMSWGDYFDHQAQWYAYNKDRKNSLILFFEDMKKDLRGTIKKLSDFLGKNLSEKAIDIITYRTTFVNMSKDPKLAVTNIPFLRKEFMNKGKVGGWRSCFNQDQIDFVDKRCKEMLDPVGLKFTY